MLSLTPVHACECSCLRAQFPPGDPLYEDAQAGAFNFTLVLGNALGSKVTKWNGVYNGAGGDIGGTTMPPSDCDNFWLYHA